ncbi:hypothetical protein LOTGIDRAFT_226175 [Lottia gigantea]|uniref:MD-2-related lipid-recognition domain-containing protein n=1 Tax=Lottia gigantea TaxID=225164 RepID=V4B0K9_LOTGI|nr:hypothetical protein LOTGIDRAFT_226175 [Lottia gigantea]ESO99686.1 hypothetical protein LOTGIDRAFT_226175 [Lottia gigantea]
MSRFIEQLLFTAFILSCLFTVVISVVPKYKQCDGSMKGKIVSVDISVKCDSSICYLVKGKGVVLSVKFAPSEMVNASTAVVEGKLGPLKVPFPLPNPNGCENSGLTCPLKPGVTVQYQSSISIKKSYPDVRVIVFWSLEDQNKNNIWCVEIPVKIVDS